MILKQIDVMRIADELKKINKIMGEIKDLII
jgi:hypothetical protein